MNSATSAEVSCNVVDAAKLPAGTGGADALCAAIRNAAADRGVGGFSVEVRVESPYLISAIAKSADGRTFPAVKTASSDSPLSARAFTMLGEAVASQLSSSER